MDGILCDTGPGTTTATLAVPDKSSGFARKGLQLAISTAFFLRDRRHF